MIFLFRIISVPSLTVMLTFEKLFQKILLENLFGFIFSSFQIVFNNIYIIFTVIGLILFFIELYKGPVLIKFITFCSILPNI